MMTKKEKNLKVSSDKPLRNSLIGAAEGNRTPTPLRAADFEFCKTFGTTKKLPYFTGSYRPLKAL